MGRHTIVGNSPVSEKDIDKAGSRVPPDTRNPGGKLGGPPSNPKYYLMTDSEKYSDGKLKRTPEGE